MKYVASCLILATLVLGSCTTRTTNPAPVTLTPEPTIQIPQAPTPTDTVTEVKQTTQETTVPSSNTTTKSYTLEEVSGHSTASSCWLVLDQKVYDVTSFIGKHPGGESILKGCGKDATQMFSRHPESAKAMKEKFYIGDLK